MRALCLGVEATAPLAGPADGLMLPVEARQATPNSPGGESAIIEPVFKTPTCGPIRLRLKMRRARVFAWAHDKT